jgi:hypothetical protein
MGTAHRDSRSPIATESVAMDQIIRHLKLMFVAEKPLPAISSSREP